MCLKSNSTPKLSYILSCSHVNKKHQNLNHEMNQID